MRVQLIYGSGENDLASGNGKYGPDWKKYTFRDLPDSAIARLQQSGYVLTFADSTTPESMRAVPPAQNVNYPPEYWSLYWRVKLSQEPRQEIMAPLGISLGLEEAERIHAAGLARADFATKEIKSLPVSIVNRLLETQPGYFTTDREQIELARERNKAMRALWDVPNKDTFDLNNLSEEQIRWVEDWRKNGML
jgi:hypothetical protein